MGVKGLKYFISKHTTGSLVTRNISKCRLLIDGSNLMYFLYTEQTKTNIAFGGDYDAYVDQINIFFNALDQCSIESCVILDGGVSLRKSSIQHGIRTFRYNTFGALNATPEDPSEVVPALFRSVFVSAVRRHGVTVLQADDIADDELCTLSTTFGLPVLSADTDFCLRGIPVILLSSFEYRKLSKEEDADEGQPHSNNFFIKGQLFNKDTFCELLDINPEHILLLSTLGMNDNLAFFTLRGFVKIISKGLIRDRTWTYRLFAINAVRRWLSRHKDIPLPQLVRMVVDLHPSYTRAHKMEQLEQLLLRVVQVSPYSSKLQSWFSTGPDDLPCGHAAFVSSCPSPPPPGSDLLLRASVTPELMDLHRDKRQRAAQMTSSLMLEEMRKASQYVECPHADTELNFAGGLALPRWFAIAQKQALVHFDAAELLVKKTVFTHPMTEKMNRKSAYLVAMPIVEVIMAICEKTYLEQERNFLEEQMEVLQLNEGQLEEQVRETIESQIIEHQVNHIQYMKALNKMNRKKKKETGGVDRKPKFRMDWLVEDEKKKKRAMKKKIRDKSGKSSEANPRNSVDGSGENSPSCEEVKQCPIILEEQQSEALVENQSPSQLEEDADDIKNLKLNSATEDDEMNFDIEEVGKGSIDEYLGWFKNTKNYHAPQILDSDSVREQGDKDKNSPNSYPEDDSLNKADGQNKPSITELETHPTSFPSKNIPRRITDLKCVDEDKPIVHVEAMRDIAVAVEPEEQRCLAPVVTDGTAQPLSDSHLEEQDDTLGDDSDDNGSILGEEELMNMPTSAFFCGKSETRQDGEERDYRGQPNLPESSFNFDSSSFLHHQESDWRNDDDSDVIIEESEDDSDFKVTPASSSSLGNGLLTPQNESTVTEDEVLQARSDDYAGSHDERFQTNQVDCSQASDDSDVIIESTVTEEEVLQARSDDSAGSHNERFLTNQVDCSQGSDDDSDVIIEDSREESESIHNGVNFEQVTKGNLIGNDEQLQVKSRLIEEHRELGPAPLLCHAQEEKERMQDCSNSSFPVEDSTAHNKSGSHFKNFLKADSKYTKGLKSKNYVTPLSEKKRNKKNKNNSLIVNDSSLNDSNPTDISVGADDSRQLPEHLTTGECEAKSFNDADFQILFSGHCLTLEIKDTSLPPNIKAQLRTYYESVCDKLRRDITIISDALKQGEDVETTRDLLLEKLNDRLMKNMRLFLEKECDRQLLLEGQQMSDNDYNICFLNGALQKLDVLKVIPYRERPYKWYVRKSFLRSLFVLKLKNETNLSTVPALQELPSKTTVQRKSLVCDFLNEPLNTYNCLPGDLQLMLMSISYWYNHSSLRLNRCHVYVLLLCVVMFYFVDPIVGRERNPVKLKALVKEEENKLKGKNKKNQLQLKNVSANHNIAFIASHLDRYSCVVAAQRLSEYHKVNKAVTTGKLKKHFVHSMCEFQACFNYIGALNSFLGSPFLFPSIELVLNCTFAYNAFRELSVAKYHGTVLSQRLGEKMQMTYLMDALHQFVGKAINIPMVLDLYPKVIQQVNKNGELIKKHVASVNLSEKLKKEQARIEKENEMAQLDALTKEFDDLDLRKAQQAKRKAALNQKQLSSTSRTKKQR